MKKLFLYLFAVGATISTEAQVTTNGGSGLAANYPSLADAVTALNAATINSPVLITLTGNETAPAGGYVVTAQGTLANPITITGTNSAITVTASAAQTAGNLNDGIIKLVGADFVTLTGFSLRENAANTTTDEFTNNMTEWGVALIPGSGTNGAQNNTIRAMDIRLNKNYANSFGIYANTAHTASDVVTLADITSGAGGNDNLKVYSTTISNVNIPVAVVGSPAFPGMGLDIGGPSAGEGNTLTDWGTTSLYAAFARLDNKINANVSSGANSLFTPVPGILAVNQLGPNISHNTLTNSTAGNADGALLGIFAPNNGIVTYPGTPLITNMNANKFNLNSNVFGVASSVPLIYGIRVHTGDAVSTVHIDTTEFIGVNHVTANSPGADTLIYSFAQVKHLTMNANKFQNLQIGHTGNLALMAIYSRVFMPLDGTQILNNNVVSALFRSSTAAVGATVGISKGVILSAVATDGSEAGSVFRAENNNFLNINTNGGSFSGIINFDGKQGFSTLSKNVIGNTFSGIDTRFTTSTTTTGGSVTFVGFTSRGGEHNVSNNVMENINTANPLTFGFITGVNNSGFFTGMTYNIQGNIMRNWDGAQLQGISLNGPATISNNQFYGWNGRTTVGAGNAVANMTSIPTGATVNITKNKIGDITNPLIGTINGLNLGTGAGNTVTLNIYNNFIGDLKTPVATNINAISGINITGGNLLVADVAYNTIYLNASSSSVTTFGTSCILFNGSATPPTLKLRNNILMNLSTPAQEGTNNNANGVTAALRRSALGTLGVAPANYDIASNNNLFYVNPAAGTNNHLSYVEGGILGSVNISNAQNTFAQMKTFMTNRDQASVTENTTNNPFLSLDANSPSFLHVNPAFIFTVGNAGTFLGDVATDFDGEARNATTPDIGADEYTQNGDAVPLPVTLVLLNGAKSGTDNVLTWVTTTEINNREFGIQRSTNGSAFTTIGKVASKASGGNSNKRLTYSFTDFKAAGGNMYYRLAQTDLDGRIKYSNVIMIADKLPTVAGISNLYPNPTSGAVTLVVKAVKNENAMISVTDAGGRVVLNQSMQVMAGTNTITLNENRLNGGIYFIKVQMDQMEKPESIRFMKQ